MKLPICTAPVDIHRNPTIWPSTWAARDWVCRVIAHRAVDMTLEEAFRAHDRTFGKPVKAYSTACPAGNPCPATGCPACCPSYDPCGEVSCTFRCNPQKGLTVTPDDAICRKCGSGDPVHHNQLVARGLIHHKWNEEEVHVPEEAELAKKCVHSCEADGVNYRECPVHGAGETTEDDQGASDEVLDKACGSLSDEVVTRVTDGIRNAYAGGNGPDDILAFTIGDLQELCNLAMQPKRPTDKDRELIAKATIERRDKQRQKLDVLHMALELHKSGNHTRPDITMTATDLLSWLAE